MSPSVSVIIVSWNALPLLERCLPSVVKTDYDNLEIVVADNASTDGTSEWIARSFPSVRVIRHPENWRFARGNNEAIRQTSSEYVVLLNNDVEVPADWLRPLVADASNAPDVAAVQPRILQFDQRDVFEYAGAAGGFIDLFGYPFARGRVFDSLESDRNQYADPRDIFWATGAAMLLRRTALDRVGLLDERFEMHMEEIDLCWRLHRHGYRVRVVPDSRVFHVGGGSLAAGNPRKTYYNFRNSLLLLYKNLPPRLWLRVFPRRAALDAVAAARALATGNAAEARAIYRAYADAHWMKSHYDAERPAADAPLPPHLYRRSIVIDYFVRGRRTFSELPESAFTTAAQE